MTTTADIQAELSTRILSLPSSHPVRVGINGVDGSGKTRFAQNLVTHLRAQTTRQVISASIDNFHNPRSVRHHRGRASAEGFYRDSFNIEALVTNLLEPLSTSPNPHIITTFFDLKSDMPTHGAPQPVDPDAILILEGIFLFNERILPHLDFKVFLDAPFDITLTRMLIRDTAAFANDKETTDLFNQRYMPGQQLYLHEAHPREKADVVIDNSDYNHPRITS